MTDTALRRFGAHTFVEIDMFHVTPMEYPNWVVGRDVNVRRLAIDVALRSRDILSDHPSVALIDAIGHLCGQDTVNCRVVLSPETFRHFESYALVAADRLQSEGTPLTDEPTERLDKIQQIARHSLGIAEDAEHADAIPDYAVDALETIMRLARDARPGST